MQKLRKPRHATHPVIHITHSLSDAPSYAPNDAPSDTPSPTPTNSPTKRPALLRQLKQSKGINQPTLIIIVFLQSIRRIVHEADDVSPIEDGRLSVMVVTKADS